MQDLRKTIYCLRLQTKHKFNGYKAYSLSTPMVVRSLDLNGDPFHLKEDDKQVSGPNVLHLNVLVKCTRPHTSSFKPIKKVKFSIN